MKRFFVFLLMLTALIAACIALNTTQAQAASESDLTFTLNYGRQSYSVTDCKISASGELTIPATYNGKPVTSIGTEAFYNCTNLTSVTIPDSVTSIGSYAFSGCSGLTSISIPDSVTSIGKYAFDNCYKLIRVDITDIAAWCEISFRNLPSNPLRYAENLYLNGQLVTKLVIPEGTANIADYAFCNCTGLTSISIPDGVTSIGHSAFFECTSLTSVIIPDSVISIDRWAFRDCNGLISVDIGNGVTSIGDSAFYSCDSLTSVTIGNSVTCIGDYGFCYCRWLKSITIPDSVTSIGSSAFSGCTSLKSITIPDSVTSIGDSAFRGCDHLTSVTIGNSVTRIESYAFEHCTGLTSIIIPDSVTSIGDYAFTDCTGLTSVTMGNGVTSIGPYAFENCTSIQYYEYDNAKYLGNATNPYVALIKANSTAITSCEIHSGTKLISSGAFDNCIGLTGITIPNGVAGIGVSAFEDCTGLTNITIPNSVTSIGTCAFRRCTGLTSITIPDSVTNIAHSAFYNCESLTDVTIGNSVTSIDYYAFYGCTKLTSITIPNSVTSIGAYAFENCKSLISITIPDRVTSIGYYAFYGCTKLTSITIPDSVTSIGNRAFSSCDSLTSITIPNSVTSIGDSAFWSCDSLTSVTIGKGVTAIGWSAFEDCRSLTSVTIPKNVTSIDSYAFDNCTGLSDVYYTGTQAQWDAISVGSNNSSLLNATLHYVDHCESLGHTYDHVFDTACNDCDETRETNGTFDFENYRVVFSDPDETHKNWRAVVYKLGDETITDPTDENVLKAIDGAAVTKWGINDINKILLTDAGNYVVLLKYNIGTALVRVPLVIRVTANPKLIIDKNNKITALDSSEVNINHRVVVYYLGDQTVTDVYDEAALLAIDPEPETVWKIKYIDRIALTKGGNYVLHLCYNEGQSAKLTVAQQFTVESIPTLSVNNNNKIVVAEENTENKNHRAVVYYLGETLVEDPYDEAAVKAAAVTTSKTYWGLSAINKVELTQGGNYVIHLYYNVGTSEKRTLALDVTLNERLALSVDENNKLVVSYTDPAINTPRAYIYKVGDAEIADIYDEAALKAIATPTQVWGLSSINKKTLTPGTYVIHLHYNVGTSAKKTVAIRVTV